MWSHVQVSAGARHTLLLAASGAVHACGNSEHGQTGCGEIGAVFSVTRMPTPAAWRDHTPVCVYACGDHSFAILQPPPPPPALSGVPAHSVSPALSDSLPRVLPTGLNGVLLSHPSGTLSGRANADPSTGLRSHPIGDANATPSDPNATPSDPNIALLSHPSGTGSGGANADPNGANTILSGTPGSNPRSSADALASTSGAAANPSGDTSAPTSRAAANPSTDALAPTSGAPANPSTDALAPISGADAKPSAEASARTSGADANPSGATKRRRMRAGPQPAHSPIGATLLPMQLPNLIAIAERATASPPSAAASPPSATATGNGNGNGGDQTTTSTPSQQSMPSQSTPLQSLPSQGTPSQSTPTGTSNMGNNGTDQATVGISTATTGEAHRTAVQALLAAVQMVFQSPGWLLAGFSLPGAASGRVQGHGLDLDAIAAVYSAVLSCYENDVVVALRATIVRLLQDLLERQERNADDNTSLSQSEWLRVRIFRLTHVCCVCCTRWNLVEHGGTVHRVQLCANHGALHSQQVAQSVRVAPGAYRVFRPMFVVCVGLGGTKHRVQLCVDHCPMCVV